MSLLATIAVVSNDLYLQILRTHTSLFKIFSLFTHIFLLFFPKSIHKGAALLQMLDRTWEIQPRTRVCNDTLDVVPDIVTLKEEWQTAAEGKVGSHFAFVTYMFFALSLSRDHWAQRLCFSDLKISNTWKWLNRKIYIGKQFS